MTAPANRLGGVRGPEGSTLDDVVAGLAAVVAGLSDLRSDVAGLATTVAAGTAASEAAAATLSGDVAPGIAAVWDRLAALAGDPFTTLADLDSRLSAVLLGVGDLSAAVGDVNGPPEGSTVKDLLRSMDSNLLQLRECCEEGQGGGGGPDDTLQNEPPGGFCPDLTPNRVVAWFLLGSDTVGGTPVEVWAPAFGATLAGLRSYESVAGNPAFGVEPGTEGTFGVCLSWDFTGNTLPLAWGRDKSTNANAVADSVFVGAPDLDPGSTLQTGGYQDTLEGSEFGDGQHVGYKFAFPVGTSPARNCWLAESAPS